MDYRYAPPAIAPVWDLLVVLLSLPSPPAVLVDAGSGDVLVLRVDTPRLVPCDEGVLEIPTVGGLVGVASGSLPAA